MVDGSQVITCITKTQREGDSSGPRLSCKPQSLPQTLTGTQKDDDAAKGIRVAPLM